MTDKQFRILIKAIKQGVKCIARVAVLCTATDERLPYTFNDRIETIMEEFTADEETR